MTEGLFKVTVAIGDREDPALFLLKSGRFIGFDVNNNRFSGTYQEDVEREEIVFSLHSSLLVRTELGERSRLHSEMTVRVPNPPPEPEIVWATQVAIGEDPNFAHSILIIERLSGLEI